MIHLSCTNPTAPVVSLPLVLIVGDAMGRDEKYLLINGFGTMLVRAPGLIRSLIDFVLSRATVTQAAKCSPAASPEKPSVKSVRKCY